MIVRLTGEGELQLDQLGGKACGLVRLLAAGLDVPEAWVIPASVSLDPELRHTCLDADLRAWWRQVVAEFPDSSWAVRSSAVAEDLDGASFAGVYETTLGVDSPEALATAVESAWSALEEARATSYLAAQGMTTEAGIALVLQRMVEADVAGVMLTENPMRPFHDELVVDAAWGLGESVVSGRTDPDHVVLDRDTGEVLSTRVGAKQLETVWVGELRDREVPAGRRAICSLAPDDLKRLHVLATQVGEAIGPRRDLEWAIESDRLYVLQDRPITGLPPREPKQVWSRRFGDEYLAEYMSPLGHGLLCPWITGPQMSEVAELQGRPELAAVEKLRRYQGYAYINGDYVLELVRALPPDRREGPITAWFDDLFVARIMAVPYERRLLLRLLRAPGKDKGRGPAKANLAALERHCADIDARVVPKLRQDYPALTAAEWQRQYDEADALGQDHFRVIRWGMAHHGPLLQALLTDLLARWLGADAGGELQTLISGLPGTRTAEINRDLWRLGTLARKDPDVLGALRGDLPYDDARQVTATSDLWPAFDAFLDQHGHRSASREVSAARWHEQPDVVLGLVRAQVRPASAGAGPMEFEQRAEARRREAERRILTALGRGPAGAVRRRILSRVLRQVQAFTVYRENQRYHLDYLLDHLHQLLLEQGRRLVERGLLPDRADVFLLSPETFTEIVGAVSGEVSEVSRTEVAAEVEEAREHRARYDGRLPAAYLFDEVPTEGRVEAVAAAEDGSLVGFGASAGQVTGVIRAVADLAELSSVAEGDILLASNIDPGWTSVFPLIAGLVTETGGILSHGAILAREYGIPTVTSLDGALTLLPTGTRVTVDGTAGTVRIVGAE